MAIIGVLGIIGLVLAKKMIWPKKVKAKETPIILTASTSKHSDAF